MATSVIQPQGRGAQAGALCRLLDSARRRSIAQVALEEGSFALALAMGGAVALLIAGTQILNWYWPVALFAGTFGWGLWRGLRRVPDRYALAQRVDRSMRLADTLSTAVFFEQSGRRADEDLRKRQRAEAESMAAGVDAVRALPGSAPKSLYPALALALAAVGLFGIRYGMLGSLNLQPSLVKIAFESFFSTPDSQLLAKNGRKLPPDLKKVTVPADENERQPDGNDVTPDNLLDTVDVPNVNGNGDKPETKSAAKGPQNQQPEGGDEEKGEKSAEGGEQGQNAGNQQDGKQGNQDGNKTPQQQNAKQGQDSSSSLMDKVRDAMANLMNKLKPQQSQSQQGKGQQEAKSGQMQKGQKGQQADNSSNQNGADNQDAKGQQQGEGGEKSQNAQAKGGDKANDSSSSQDGKSGIGRQDGNKDERLAAELEAMGKISEIIGKRQQNISGEVMMEVSSSKQNIRTPWTQKNATHTDAGGEVHRDEVPLIYQQYVQQYFEEIRKPAAAAGEAKPSGSAKRSPSNR